MNQMKANDLTKDRKYFGSPSFCASNFQVQGHIDEKHDEKN